MEVMTSAPVAMIAGGRGFVGAAVAKALLDINYRICIVDNGLFLPVPQSIPNETRSTALFHSADASNADDLEMVLGRLTRLDLVVNCAGPARPSFYQRDPLGTVHSLVGSTSALLDLCKRTSARYIHASSSEVYGSQDSLRLTERSLCGFLDPHCVRAPYAEAKRLCETLAKAYSDMHGIHATVLRLFNVYGPGFSSDDDRVVPALINATRDSGVFAIHGTGEQTRCFTYIDDVARAFSLCATGLDGRFTCMNIGNPEPVSITELVRLTGDIAHCRVKTEQTPARSSEVFWRTPDISHAHRVLGWEPTVPLRLGLQRTLHEHTK